MLEGVDVSDEQLAAQQAAVGSAENVGIAVTGLSVLLRLAMRLPPASLKAEQLAEDLTELKLPADLVTDIGRVVFGSRRESIVHALQAARPHYPGLVRLLWRVDVGISTSALARTLKPCVLMRLALTDGTVRTIELSADKFHDLRYAVACILKEMEAVEKRNILKISD